jgi:tryptophanyl-tRNA synthetase
MAEQEHHAELIKGIAEQMKILLKESKEAIYIYFDDAHKVCNKKFADLLGYKSPKAWADAEVPLSDVLEEDQQKVINAYMNASENAEHKNRRNPKNQYDYCSDHLRGSYFHSTLFQ